MFPLFSSWILRQIEALTYHDSLLKPQSAEWQKLNVSPNHKMERYPTIGLIQGRHSKLL